MSIHVLLEESAPNVRRGAAVAYVDREAGQGRVEGGSGRASRPLPRRIRVVFGIGGVVHD